MRPWLVKLNVVRLALNQGAISPHDRSVVAQAPETEIKRRGAWLSQKNKHPVRAFA